MKRHVPYLGSFSLAWILGLGLFSESKVSIYGRMTFEIRARSQTQFTPFSAEIYANPAGSRNLEFDPQKLVRK